MGKCRRMDRWKEYTIHHVRNRKSTTNEYKDYDIVYERVVILNMKSCIVQTTPLKVVVVVDDHVE